MNVSLTPMLEEFIQKKVASGLYNSASEVIREALRLLEERDEMRRMKLETLRTDIAVGLDQIDQGEVTEYDDQTLTTLAADIKAKGRKHLSKKEVTSGMSQYRLSRQSRLDLDDIWLYIASDSVTAADNIIDELIGKLQTLTEQPGMG